MNCTEQSNDLDSIVKIQGVYDEDTIDNESETDQESDYADEIEICEEYETTEEVMDQLDDDICLELKKLYSFYEKKKEKKEEILELIWQAIVWQQEHNTECKKRVFVKFIQAGLIKECNELGLIALLEEIRRMIY